MRERADVRVDVHQLSRHLQVPLHHGFAWLRGCGTIAVEPHGQSRASIRLNEREWNEHVRGLGGEAGEHSGDGGIFPDPVDDELLADAESPASTAQFSALVRQMSAELTAFVTRRLGRGEAEDVVSEIFVVVWRRWDQVPADPDGQRAWVYEVAKRTTMDALKGERRRTALASRVATSGQRPRSAEPEADLLSRESIEGLLVQLPDGQAQALRLTIVEGRSSAEAADQLGISVTALTTRLARARKVLQLRLTAEERRNRDRS